eukprot:TRINITY_DN2021_c0_g1_i2.p1 TRINITY_DN2021_c0_g1~~TRINITY_DN2021_c0_g1_i2.p1  ORF type:complete len:270 (+),score=41.55 TRINITY_DN2021_c0_g1_i2:164-973(+)
MTILKGKVVLITGAGMGIGREMAFLFAREECRLVLLDIRLALIEKVSVQIKEERPDSQIYCSKCDVANRDEVYEVSRKVLADVGRVDVLINNAGIVSGGKLMEISDQQIIRSMEVNALGNIWMVRAFLPAMLEANEGHIVSICSAAGIVGASGMTDYCASKFAVFGFHESLRLELKHMEKDIKTTIICPAYVTTGMFDGYQANSCLTPPLSPQKVAKTVLRAVKSNSYQIAIPQPSCIVYLSRLLPMFCFDGMMECFGVSKAMDTFKGR